MTFSVFHSDQIANTLQPVCLPTTTTITIHLQGEIRRKDISRLLGIIALMSFFIAPLFREKLNTQFMLGARNQSFLTEYVSGMATVKSLQMEPDIDRKYGDLLSQYLAAGFSTKQIGNTYNVIANGIEQVMTLSILIVGAVLVMRNEGFTVGMRVYGN